MKNKISKNLLVKTGMFVLFATALTSCKKYLDIEPLSVNSKDDSYSSVSTAESHLLGAYQQLCGDAGFGIRMSIYYIVDNDEMTLSSATGTARGDIAHGYASETNGELAAPYSQLYVGINAANDVIQNIPLMPLYSSGLPEQREKLRTFYGEALAVRALLYHELIKNWGDVPVSYLPSDEASTAEPRPNTIRWETYDKLIEDLREAEELVPSRSVSGALPTRISLGGVRALRARLSLFRAGWAQNANTGIMEHGPNYKSYYDTARKECLAIINSGDYDLNPSYEAFFKDGICAHAIDPKESVYEVQMTPGGGSSSDSKMGYANGPKTVGGQGNGFLRVLPNFFYLFDSTDTRRDVNIAQYLVGNSVADVSNIRATNSMSEMYDGKFRRDWIRNPANTPDPQRFGLDWPMIRYSDVLLMFAEADNEVNNGPSPEAIQYFEKVRHRAYGAADIGITPNNHDDFFKAIVDERSREFGGEGLRKFDLIRWNLLWPRLRDTRQLLMDISVAVRDKAILPAPYSNYPLTVYAKAVNGKLEYFNSFYQPAPNPSDVTGFPDPTVNPAAGGSKVSWLSSVYSSSSPDPLTGVASIYYYLGINFKPEFSHLLPYPISARNNNPLLKQNTGY